ncbi:DUF1080 domain-containing protein [candidate division KSB1 bacterium]|nr:DUF1080 domain-containing protein [candidate division KSB1 bacterium]MBL7095201.1 DUF1080 domain-containing protein [candidate division KSB1 bacterium]
MFNKTATLLLVILVLFSILQCAKQPAVKQDVSIDHFVGRWALSLSGGAGWLEVRQEENYLDADILWYGGSVIPVDNVVFKDNTLIITRNRRVIRKKDEAGNPIRTQTLTTLLELFLKEGELIGKQISPKKDGIGVEVNEFTGKKIPDLPAAPDLSGIKFGQPITLFNGKDLAGWELIDSTRQNGFKVEDGALINNVVQVDGQPHIHYGNLRTVEKFEDFNLKMQVNIPKGSNSGIYLRGIYEVQVYDSYKKGLDSHHMGAIYSRITPTVAAEKPAGLWQDFDITLCDRHVTVILNGKKIINNQPLLGVTGGALTADEFSPGPIYFQGDHGIVSYRNIVLTPIVNL